MAFDFNQRFARTGDSFLLQDADLRGGFRVVNSIAERDAIPLPARKSGMTVRVAQITGTVDYTLPVGRPITNAGWEVEQGGGGGVADGIDFVVAKMQRENAQVVYSVPPLTGKDLPPGTNVYDVPPEEIASYNGALLFNNGYENTIEVSVHSGQIVARREVGLSSDETLKFDIKEITAQEAEADLISLQGQHYTWKSNKQKSSGFIAQWVKKVIPDAVIEMRDGTLGITLAPIVARLVSGVNGLFQRTQENEKTIELLKQEIEELRRELHAMKEGRS